MPLHPIVSAAILVGGQARRLGGADKHALVVGGRSMLDRQLAALRALTPDIRLIAREGQPHPGVGVPVLIDRKPGAGPLGGIYTALLESRAEHVLVVAADMPFLTVPFLEYLARVHTDAANTAAVDATVPRDAGGRHPLCAVYHAGLADRIRARVDAGALAVQDALDAWRVRDVGPDDVARFDPDGCLLMNVNTPEDYARALAAETSRAPVAPEYHDARDTRHERRE